MGRIASILGLAYGVARAQRIECMDLRELNDGIAIPTIEEISEAIRKLEGLKQHTEEIKAIAENGEDPEKAQAQLQKAEEYFREHRNMMMPAQRPYYVGDVSPSIRAKISAMRDSGDSPGWAGAHLTAMNGIGQTFINLPISLLRKLRTVVIPGIWMQDEHEVMSDLTVGQLKGSLKRLEKAKEDEVSQKVRTETSRVFHEVEVILCPYQEFLRQEAGNTLIQPTDAPRSITAEIHQHKKIMRRLEVKALQQADEERQGPQIKSQNEVPQLGTHSDIRLNEISHGRRGAAPGKNVLGMTWEEVRARAEEYLVQHVNKAPTSKRKMCNIIGCAAATLDKAIRRSPRLQEWEAKTKEWRANKSAANKMSYENILLPGDSEEEDTIEREGMAAVNPLRIADRNDLLGRTEGELLAKLRRLSARKTKQANNELSENLDPNTQWEQLHKQVGCNKDLMVDCIIALKEQLACSYDTDPEAKFKQERTP